MISSKSVKYVYDNILSLDTGSFVLWYPFVNNGNLTVPNSGNYPECSGRLSSLGNFYSSNDTGNLTGQSISISNPQLLNAQDWTHLFVQQKSNKVGGVLFDSFMSGNGILSGYILGVTDSNRLYYESYDDNGPFVAVSKLTYGEKNCSAIIRGGNLITFYTFDFASDSLLSDQFVIKPQFMPPSNKAVLFNTGAGCPSYVSGRPYSGQIDEYFYFSGALIASNLKELISGLIVDYTSIPGSVTSYSTTGITGYSYQTTGVTGVLGTVNTILTSGVDNCGNSYLTYSVQTITGYITSGSGLLPVYNVTTVYETGDSYITGALNTGYKESFKLNEVSYLRKIDGQDLTAFAFFDSHIGNINKEGIYDFVENCFKLDQSYDTNQLNLYLNGLSQISTGYSVTGNFYHSGHVLSGDYILDSQLVISTGYHSSADYIVYDILSGAKMSTPVTSPISGSTESLPIQPNSLIFLNGQLLLSGLEYKSVGGSFVWNNTFPGYGGLLTAFVLPVNINILTGIFPQSRDFPRKASMVWLNGQRQKLNLDIIENSSSDLIGASGLYESNLSGIYLEENNFWNV